MNPALPGNFILIGDVGCGKSTLINHIFGYREPVTKTQALAFHGDNVIDSPGEFVNRRYLYGALLNSVVGVDTIVYLHAADQQSVVMPGDLLRMYDNKHVVGVVSKVDIEGADIATAELCLAQAGIARPYFQVSVKDPASVRALVDYICRLTSARQDAAEAVGSMTKLSS
jgi:ethanolamine utilization protein EutP